MKQCNYCGAVKAVELFASGRKCRECAAAYLRQYRAVNADAIRQKRKAKYNKTMADPVARDAENARNRARYALNHARERARSAKYYDANKDRIADKYASNPRPTEVNTEAMRSWRRANPAKAKASKVAYYSRMKKAPPWSDKNLVADIYRYAKIMREAGIACHVDHIIPLRGKKVSGLHVHTNLTVILAEHNVRKNAKFEVV